MKPISIRRNHVTNEILIIFTNFKVNAREEVVH